MWNIIKRNNIQILAIPEREKKEKRTQGMLKAMFKKFPNMGVGEMDIWIHESQGKPYWLKPDRATPRHVIINCQK